MAQAHFEIFLDTDEKHRFRFRAPSGDIIVASEAYESKDGCKDGIEAVRTYARYAQLQDLTLKVVE